MALPSSKLSDLLVGESKEMTALKERVSASAEADVPLLIHGERGTGRERVARVLHEVSPRRGRRFVRLVPDDNRSEIDRNFERAAGGTLLVKDVARFGRGPQRRLLKVMRGRARGGVRVVAATVFDLGRAVADEHFDAELFDRLGAQTIVVPALRTRMADVPLLAARFARDAGAEIGRARSSLAPRAVDRLLGYPWPGNVAELKDVVARATFHARRATVEEGDVAAALPPLSERAPLEDLSFEEMVRAKISGLLERLEGHAIEDLYEQVLQRVERPLIELVLARTRGSQLRAAKMLGLNRNTLRKKIAERGIASDGKK